MESNYEVDRNCEAEEVHQQEKPMREIWVSSFNEKAAKLFRMQVLEACEGDPDRPVVVYIDSYGGNVDSLAVFLGTMDEMPNPFITVAMGKAMSAGAILLSHGDYRYCDRYARVMVHEIQGASWGNVRGVKNDTQEMLRLNAKFMELLAKNCGLKGYDELKAKFKTADVDELWMSPEDAKAFGLVDYIGLPKLLPSVQYQCAVLPEKPSRRDQKPKTESDTKAKLKVQSLKKKGKK